MSVTRVLAIDLGASSGRGIVFEYNDGALTQNIVHRFPNFAIERDGKLYWDLNMLYAEIIKCIEYACKEGKLHSIGIDSWGVDFGFVSKEGEVLSDDFRHYRNLANAEVRQSLDIDIRKRLFDIAGISDNDFNTTYQLIARHREKFNFNNVKYMLFTPQLLGYMLTGIAVSEPTIASTSGFYRYGKGFDKDFLTVLDIPQDILPNAVETCSVIGDLKQEIKDELGIDYYLPLIATPAHDTACGVLGLPSQEEHTLFLSSGTWSLFGALEDKPIVSKSAWELGYTNECAYGGKVRFLRNIMGMWIIQECRRQWIDEGKGLDYSQIVNLAKESKDKGAFIDVNDNAFAMPCKMADKVKEYVFAHQGIILESEGEVARCVYFSLAKAYKDAYISLKQLTGREYAKLYIIGGGANNKYLNRLIADMLNINVSAGPIEASALGNALGQLVGLGVIDQSQIKKIVTDNCEVKEYFPR